MREDEKVLLNAWKKVLKEFLNPIDLIEQIPVLFELGSQDYRRVLEARKEPHVAVEKALETIMQSSLSFQQFIDGVGASGHIELATLMKGSIADEDVERVVNRNNEGQYVRKYLSVIAPHIKEIINGREVAEILQSNHYGGLISEGDMEGIIQVNREEGNQASVRTLLMILTRKPAGWWLHFTKALKALQYDADLIDSLEIVCSGSATQYATSDLSEDSQDMVVEEKSMRDNAAKLVGESNLEKVSSVSKMEWDATALKTCEKHLAEATVAGANIIIFAPVAQGNARLYACILHSRYEQRVSTESPKVAIIVRTVSTAKKIQDEIKCELPADHWEIVQLAGNSKVTLKQALSTTNVMVMTPKILLNAFKDGSVPSVTEFNLVMFDECHHALKNDDYNEIMLQYLKEKGSGCEDLPQVIGTTATLGEVKHSSNAVDHVITLCANLDATGGIVTVPIEHHDEMYQGLYHPLVKSSSSEKMAEEIGKIVLMEKAAKEVQTMLCYMEAKYLENIDSKQKISISKLNELQHSEPENSSSPANFSVQCQKCLKHICSDNQIIKVDNTNHTWATREIEQKCKKQPVQHGGTENKEGIFCQCGHKLGIVANYKGTSIPQLRADALIFENITSGETVAGKTWTRVKIEFRDVSFGDFLKMLKGPTNESD